MVWVVLGRSIEQQHQISSVYFVFMHIISSCHMWLISTYQPRNCRVKFCIGGSVSGPRLLFRKFHIPGCKYKFIKWLQRFREKISSKNVHFCMFPCNFRERRYRQKSTHWKPNWRDYMFCTAMQKCMWGKWRRALFSFWGPLQARAKGRGEGMWCPPEMSFFEPS